MSGKRLRLARLRHERSSRSILIPIDHAVMLGPIAGLEQPWTIFQPAAFAGVQGVVMHKGLLYRGVERTDWRLSRVLHLSASTALAPSPARKVLVASVVEAVRLGADGVSVHVNLGGDGEAEMLRDLGFVTREGERWGMPVLAMMYVRGDASRSATAALKHAARVAAELGADLVKVAYPGSPDDFFEIVQGCFVPVLVAGGDCDGSERAVLDRVRATLVAGGSGVCIGRNVFQRAQPRSLLRALSAVVHDDLTPDEALQGIDDGALRAVAS